MSAGPYTPDSAAAAGGAPGGFWATTCGRATPNPRTAKSSSCARISRSLQRLFAPGRNDVIHPRVGNHLAQVLVKVAADSDHAVGERQIPSHDLALAGQRRGVERLELLLRVREAFVQVLDHLRLVRQRAQLGRFLTRSEIGGLCAERRRDRKSVE